MNLGVESYVVRIYRRDKENPENIAGMIEIVGIDEKKAFRNAEELCSILNAVKKMGIVKKRP